METGKTVEHKGVISSINGNNVKVNIISHSACASCQIKTICSVADTKDKVIETFCKEGDYTVGEEVTVHLKESLGYNALLLGYIIPLVILMVALFVSLEFTKNELKSALYALVLLIPYYIILYHSKNRLKKTFSFSIKKID